jgi:hypothetical protein
VVVISGNLVTINCKRLDDSVRGMNKTYEDYSNVKYFGFDTYVFINILRRTQIKQVDI